MRNLMEYAADRPIRAAVLAVTAIVTLIVVVGWVIVPAVAALFSWLAGLFIKLIIGVALLAAFIEWANGD